MNQATRQLVRTRALQRCEYCGIRQADDFLMSFHVEHIRAKKHGGADDDSNLALACHHCNLHKGANLSGIDPTTDSIVELFHPRRQRWAEHFHIEAGIVVGRTPIGRATIAVLAMNRSDRVQLRRSFDPIGESS